MLQYSTSDVISCCYFPMVLLHKFLCDIEQGGRPLSLKKQDVFSWRWLDVFQITSLTGANHEPSNKTQDGNCMRFAGKKKQKKNITTGRLFCFYVIDKMKKDDDNLLSIRCPTMKYQAHCIDWPLFHSKKKSCLFKNTSNGVCRREEKNSKH